MLAPSACAVFDCGLGLVLVRILPACGGQLWWQLRSCSLAGAQYQRGRSCCSTNCPLPPQRHARRCLEMAAVRGCCERSEQGEQPFAQVANMHFCRASTTATTALCAARAHRWWSCSSATCAPTVSSKSDGARARRYCWAGSIRDAQLTTNTRACASAATAGPARPAAFFRARVLFAAMACGAACLLRLELTEVCGCFDAAGWTKCHAHSWWLTCPSSLQLLDQRDRRHF